MEYCHIFIFAILLDVIAGDPVFFFHPVRLIGYYISFCEEISRKFFLNYLFLAGFITCLSATLISYFFVYWTIYLSHSCSQFLGNIVEIIWIWLGVAAGDLDRAVRKIFYALKSGDIVSARKNLSMIVGRDTQDLDESEISRASIESTAESLVDGVVSPIFYLILGGAPLLWAFKAISTCDSMIGHKDEKYILFGCFSARLDDTVNFIPARLSFFFIFIGSLLMNLFSSSFYPLFCLKAFLRDRLKHASPNSGLPESAFAGALNVRLGGVNYYDGEKHESELIFPEGKIAKVSGIINALKLMWITVLIMVVFFYIILKIFKSPLIFFFSEKMK